MIGRRWTIVYVRFYKSDRSIIGYTDPNGNLGISRSIGKLH